MAFCSNCGAEYNDGAKFCSCCGVSITTAINDNRRRTVFEGEMHKCPNCGEVLGSFISACPSCGYEMRGAKTSDSIREFSLRLENSKSEDQSITLIRNFPIPNTKEDVLEFMILASTNILGDIPQRVYDAWQVKFEQSYQKAKLLFDNDDEFLRIQSIYDNTAKRINKEKNIQRVKSTGKVIAKSGKLFSKILKAVFKNLLFVLGILSYCKAIQVDRGGENGVGFQLLGGLLIIIASSLLMRRQVSYIEIAIGAGCGALTFYLAKYLDNGVGLQLFGAITFVLILIGFIKRITAGNAEKGE